MVLVKAKCLECWETLGDYYTELKVPDEIQQRITEHAKKGHPIQEIEIDH
jgi:predicted small metal-binding protein